MDGFVRYLLDLKSGCNYSGIYHIDIKRLFLEGLCKFGQNQMFLLFL